MGETRVRHLDQVIETERNRRQARGAHRSSSTHSANKNEAPPNTPDQKKAEEFVLGILREQSNLEEISSWTYLECQLWNNISMALEIKKKGITKSMFERIRRQSVFEQLKKEAASDHR